MNDTRTRHLTALRIRLPQKRKVPKFINVLGLVHGFNHRHLIYEAFNIALFKLDQRRYSEGHRSSALGFEPATFCLRDRRSTTELKRPAAVAQADSFHDTISGGALLPVQAVQKGENVTDSSSIAPSMRSWFACFGKMELLSYAIIFVGRRSKAKRTSHIRSTIKHKDNRTIWNNEQGLEQTQTFDWANYRIRVQTLRSTRSDPWCYERSTRPLVLVLRVAAEDDTQKGPQFISAVASTLKHYHFVNRLVILLKCRGLSLHQKGNSTDPATMNAEDAAAEELPTPTESKRTVFEDTPHCLFIEKNQEAGTPIPTVIYHQSLDPVCPSTLRSTFLLYAQKDSTWTSHGSRHSRVAIFSQLAMGMLIADRVE
uniref:Abhydrolase_3 domain-containing protein n=2 Tax=Steinernema glaseri TaxID=37863 RepID=A0A1I8AGE3_9BILA